MPPSALQYLPWQVGGHLEDPSWQLRFPALVLGSANLRQAQRPLRYALPAASWQSARERGFTFHFNAHDVRPVSVGSQVFP